MSTDLVLLTNSVDGTSDILVELARARGLSIFRFNVDLWSAYSWEVSPSCVTFSDPTGSSFDVNSNCDLLFRKPFLTSVESGNKNIQPVLRGQIRGLIQFLVNSANGYSKLKLVEPYADQRLPKLSQLLDAALYFPVPDWSFVNQTGYTSATRLITKPLNESQLEDGNIFYTSRVSVGELDNQIPWFLQTEISDAKDVTCVFIAGESWFFQSRANREINGVDWRTAINSDNEPEWERLEGEFWASQGQLVVELMNYWGLRYGRIDFLLDGANQLWFLECNTNGQFGWLDYGDFVLHNHFLDAVLDEQNAVVMR